MGVGFKINMFAKVTHFSLGWTAWEDTAKAILLQILQQIMTRPSSIFAKTAE